MNFTDLLGPIESSTPAHLHKAILWGAESLLVDSVEHFLKTREGWDVVKISSDIGVDYLIQRVNDLKPAVVVLCQEREFSDAALLVELLQVQSSLKVIMICLDSNKMQIISKYNVIMQDVSDLLSVVDTGALQNPTIKSIRRCE